MSNRSMYWGNNLYETTMNFSENVIFKTCQHPREFHWWKLNSFSSFPHNMHSRLLRFLSRIRGNNISHAYEGNSLHDYRQSRAKIHAVSWVWGVQSCWIWYFITSYHVASLIVLFHFFFRLRHRLCHIDEGSATVDGWFFAGMEGGKIMYSSPCTNFFASSLPSLVYRTHQKQAAATTIDIIGIESRENSRGGNAGGAERAKRRKIPRRAFIFFFVGGRFTFQHLATYMAVDGCLAMVWGELEGMLFFVCNLAGRSFWRTNARFASMSEKFCSTSRSSRRFHVVCDDGVDVRQKLHTENISSADILSVVVFWSGELAV